MGGQRRLVIGAIGKNVKGEALKKAIGAMNEVQEHEKKPAKKK